MVHLTIPQQKEKLGYSFSDKIALCCWHCYFENWNSNFISTATFQLSIVSSTKPQLPLQFNFLVCYFLREKWTGAKKKSRKERRRDKNRTHQSWKSETQETKKQGKKKGTDNGQSWSERGRQEVLRGQNPLSTWSVNLFALIKYCLVSVITCSILPFRKLVGKGRYDTKWQWPG